MQCSPADRDLGVLVDGKFNMFQQFDLAAKRANPCVGCCKHFDHRSGVIGYCAHCWCSFTYVQFRLPQYRKDTDKLEYVQKKA